MNNQIFPPNDFTGLWIYTCPASGNISESEYVDGVEHGTYRKKLWSGVVIREGKKEKGLDHGEVIVRNSQGKEVGKYNFECGNGVHLIYASSGRIGWSIPYKNGKPHGIKCRYHKGKIVSQQEYCEGKRISEEIYLDEK